MKNQNDVYLFPNGVYMYAFVARQPIFNVSKEVFAYELLFRSGMSNAFPDIDGETATSSLLSSSFFTVGIDTVSNGKIVFINFTSDLISRGIPLLFPEEKIVVEILEDVVPTPEVIRACQDLHEKGYTLALDDFEFEEDLAPLIEIATIIKIDFRLTPLEEIARTIQELQHHSCTFLAEKIETYQEFERAKEMGCTYFQGYFFARPEVLKNREISSSKLTLIKLICEVNKPELDVESLAALINHDVSISYKLLKYLNSSYFSRSQPVSSTTQAIAFLGQHGIRMFASIIIASKIAEDKPGELMRASVIRANVLLKMGEVVRADSSELFMLGLFSLIDGMLDDSMDNIMNQLPLSENIKAALVLRSGSLFPFLHLIECYESCDWKSLEDDIALVKISAEMIMEFYLDAVKLADNLQVL